MGDDFPTLHALVLLVTADSRGHSEIGLTSAGGKHGCRRCNVTGEYIEQRRHYYYGNFRQRCNSPPSRTAEESRRSGQLIDNASTTVEKARLSRDFGVTGECIFYRLYDLYQFDPVKDLVIDAMHAIVLNLVRRELEDHVFATMGDNASRAVEERDPAIGGVHRRDDLIQALSKVNWTTELRDGRIPTLNPDPASNSKLGNWKAEEFSKFVAVAPSVLAGIIPRAVYDCFMLLVKIHNLVFSHYLRYSGWQIQHITYLKNLLCRHTILYEDLYGLSACTENVEYSLHLTEDIYRHSTLDNYWCYVYERLVKYYKNQTTNMKNVAKTFSTRASQERFVKMYLAVHNLGAVHVPETSTPVSEFEPLQTPSISAAISLKEQLSQDSSLSSKQRLCEGIIIGSGKITKLTSHQLNDVMFWTQHQLPKEDYPDVAIEYTKILINSEIGVGTVYRLGDVVAIRDPFDADAEWVMELTRIFSYGPINGRYFSFVDGHYYVPRTVRRTTVLEAWTQQPKLTKRTYAQLCVQKSSQVERKVILYPDPHHRDDPSFFLSVDTENFVQPVPVEVPF